MRPEEQHAPRTVERRRKLTTICIKCKTELPDLTQPCSKVGIAADVLAMFPDLASYPGSCRTT